MDICSFAVHQQFWKVFHSKTNFSALNRAVIYEKVSWVLEVIDYETNKNFSMLHNPTTKNDDCILRFQGKRWHQ